MATTLYRLAEECLKIISGGDIQAASNVSISELKISICQVSNSLLKVEHFSVNEKMGEKIPNGSVLGWYEGLEVFTWNNKSKITLPIKPLKLPRNMGVFGVYPKFTSTGSYELDKECIPLQMGQGGLIKSQTLINDVLGQIAYENFGLDIVFNKNLKTLWPDITFAVRLAILDFSEYGDYDPLPILPEQEWQIKKEVVQLYSAEGISDYLVDPTLKAQQNIPIKQQYQA